MSTETYERLLEQFAKLSAEYQAQSETMPDGWLKGYYAGLASGYETAGSITRILNDDNEPTTQEYHEEVEESHNALLHYLVSETPF